MNLTVPSALRRLGYSEEATQRILDWIDEHETIEGAPDLEARHLAVFDCAFRAAQGTRSIHWMGHVRMMGAVQPFLSGAISKTVNLPENATVEDVTQATSRAGSSASRRSRSIATAASAPRPLNAGRDVAKVVSLDTVRPVRHKLDDERKAVTHKFSIAGHEGYLTVGLYEDGQPGEIFLRMAKEGSTVSGLMDTIATMTSIALQYGVPLKALVDKFSHTRFDPSGFTTNRRSDGEAPTDYIFRYWQPLLAGEPEVERAGGADGGDGARAAAGRGGRRRLGRARARLALPDGEPGGSPSCQGLRLDHGAQRRLLKVWRTRRTSGCI